MWLHILLLENVHVSRSHRRVERIFMRKVYYDTITWRYLVALMRGVFEVISSSFVLLFRIDNSVLDWGFGTTTHAWVCELSWNFAGFDQAPPTQDWILEQILSFSLAVHCDLSLKWILAQTANSTCSRDFTFFLEGILVVFVVELLIGAVIHLIDGPMLVNTGRPFWFLHLFTS